MDALEIGVLGLVAGLHQGLEAAAHQVHHAAAQHGLLTEEVGLGLIVEGGLHHTGTGAADPGDIGQGDLHGVAGGVLLHGHQAGDALAVDILAADGVAGALGGGHEHIHAGGRDDLLVADIEAVGKGQGVALLQIGGDVLLVDVGLHLVVDEDHDDVGPLGGLGHGFDGEAGLFGVSPVFGALTESHAHVAAGILQVEGVGMSLGAVADDGDLLAVEIAELTVLFIVHLCHNKTLLYQVGCCNRKNDDTYHITAAGKRMITVIQS